jgi:hypothetical protein
MMNELGVEVAKLRKHRSSFCVVGTDQLLTSSVFLVETEIFPPDIMQPRYSMS